MDIWDIWDILFTQETVTDTETEIDEWLLEIYIQYLVSVIFVEHVIVIQSCIRKHLAKKHLMSLHRIHHNNRYRDVVRDITECGILPPDERYPLLSKGGFCYREAYDRFTHLNTRIY